ncbi:uncharacterized protein PAC_19007 [Phialocephala subalpina]|uniref:Heterokaryon incompatibility domain-containing protein n=1 Tax=Phialocephala subalpina TaxID=576137 RepID=A0A1L7XVP2_9HELO|nr:uncharacterized protein PAC_19007 [Phialocephala subalpina]
MESFPEPITQKSHRQPPQPRLFNPKASAILYSPLNEDLDEIRLINILQPLGDSALVRCNVMTVSLKALTPEYQNFLSASGSTVRSKRDTMASWNRLHPPTTFSEILNSNLMDQYIPTKPNYRFTWGDYAALSYVWGNPGLTHRIIVNDQEMRVGANLEIALRALNTRPDFQGGFKLWVDAICINQDNYEERGRQVSKMREIYGGAWTVMAWLGEEQDNSDKAIRLVQSLSDTDPERGEELAEMLLDDPEYLGDGCWIALQDLLNRPYWYRLWIIQELVLGSSALVLRCGDSFINWTTFCQGIGILFDYLWTVKDSLLHYEIYKRSDFPNRPTEWLTTSLHLVHQDLWALSHCEEQGRAHLRFDRLLNVANSTNSRDPRDKVYGLIGLMDPIIAAQLVPNYESPPSKVYASVAKIFVLTYANLDPLREGNPWSCFGTPSWAADWTWGGRLRNRSPEKTDLWGPFWTRKGPVRMAEPAPAYRASGNWAPEVSFSNNDLHLTCRGFVIDNVAGLSARGKGYFEWPETSIVQPEHENNAYGNINGVTTALYHALLADRVAGGMKASPRHSAILNLPSTFSTAHLQFQHLGWKWLSSQQSYYFRWEKWRRANRNFRLMGRPLSSYFNDEIPDYALEYDYTEVYSCFDRTCKGRRFMTTENGYLGWAPDNVVGEDEEQTGKGDLITIIFGCSTPLVIRPHGGYFQVVGEAYVQGLMDGEALELLDTGGYLVQDFTFC